MNSQRPANMAPQNADHRRSTGGRFSLVARRGMLLFRRISERRPRKTNGGERDSNHGAFWAPRSPGVRLNHSPSLRRVCAANVRATVPAQLFQPACTRRGRWLMVDVPWVSRRRRSSNQSQLQPKCHLQTTLQGPVESRRPNLSKSLAGSDRIIPTCSSSIRLLAGSRKPQTGRELGQTNPELNFGLEPGPGTFLEF